MSPTAAQVSRVERARRQGAALALLPASVGLRFGLLEDGVSECWLFLEHATVAQWEAAVDALVAVGERFGCLTFFTPPKRGVAAAVTALLSSSRLAHFAHLKRESSPRFSASVLKALASNPAAATLTALTLNQVPVTDAAAALLAKSPNLTALRELDLTQSLVSAKGLQALLRAKPLESLTISWDASSNKDLSLAQMVEALSVLSRAGHALRSLTARWALDREGMEALTSGEHFARLQRLELWSWRLDAAALSVLAGALGHSALEALHLCSSGLAGHEGLYAPLLGSPALGRLRELNLEASHVSTGDLEVLARNPALGGLEALDLSNLISVQEPGWSALAATKTLAPKRLKLRSCKAAAGQLGALLSGHLASRLERLELSFVDVGATVPASLEGWRAARALRELDLFSCGLDDAAFRPWLAAVRDAPLEKMRLGYNSFTTAGLAALLDSPFSRTLRELDLGRTAWGDEGARLLAASPALERLRTLYVADEELTADGVRALAESPHLAEGMELWGFEREDVERWREVFLARGVLMI